VKNRLLCVAAAFAAASTFLAAGKAQALPSGPVHSRAGLQFEVASIKECKSTDPRPPSTNSPDRLSLGCWPLWRLISDAYGVFPLGKYDPGDFTPPPIEGPDWINRAGYSIDAKTERPQSAAMMLGPMMQALLEDRFHLRLRREIREVPVYFMSVAKDGLKVEATKEGTCNSVDPTDLAQSFKATSGGKPWCYLPRIARTAEKSVYDVAGVRLGVFFNKIMIPGRPVIDQTGLTAAYDIHLELENLVAGSSPPTGAASDPPGTSIVAAIRKQLGLQLDPGKGPHEFLVVEHVERPSEN
jgi:uncharacterized protein (TIGR03435 family)